jgi:hypothetical protein
MHGTLDAYVVSLPGLDKSTATNYGHAGAVVTVGESQHWVDSLVERAQKLKVGEGFDPSTDV